MASVGQVTYLVLDATWMARAAWHAVPSMRNGLGQEVGAVHAFTNSLLRLLKDLEPRYVMACFDRPGDTLARAKVFPAYKEGHTPPEPDFLNQLPLIQRMCTALGVPRYSMPGAEADDLIGTLVSIRPTEEKAVVYSRDRDMWQLVSKDVSVLSGQTWVTPGVVRSKQGVRPDQVVDFKALFGDAGDGIPHFLGEKTTQKLLEDYDTLEAILDQRAGLKPRIRSVIDENERQIVLNKWLATIRKDLPLRFPAHEFSIQVDSGQDELSRLGLRQLQGRLLLC